MKEISLPDPTTDFEIEKLIKLKLNPIDEKSRGSGYTLYGESYYWVTPAEEPRVSQKCFGPNGSAPVAARLPLCCNPNPHVRLMLSSSPKYGRNTNQDDQPHDLKVHDEWY